MGATHQRLKKPIWRTGGLHPPYALFISVIPVKTGTQSANAMGFDMGPRLHGDDGFNARGYDVANT